jgi:SecD/SecF fusion protein
MVIYYSQAGWFANLALFVNVFFIMGILASLGAVLTLPGIAGIVLTIGMSVDANVLIYERIREELASGKGNRLAIADGYKNAYSSIIDANVTTLITGIILYVFGSGPILGFATTLIIGILTSLFSAIFITRLLFEARVNADKSIRFVSPFFKSTWFENSKFDFVSRRKVFYAISSLIIVAGIVSLFTKGLNLGVDFKGGRSYIVRFDEDVTTQNVREALTTSFGISPEVKTFGSNNQIKITTSYLIDNQDEAADAQVEQALLSGLSSLNKGGEIMSSQKVGPTIANDIKVSAVYAIVLSILAIFLYIVVRFRRWQFGLGAVVALFHDVMVLISIFSIFNGILPFSLDVDQAFIAAILTVMGYSINDTVVVFDRIREYLNLHHTKNEGLSEVINNALNSTLSRTVVTGLTTILVLIILFFFGGEVIRGFSFAMLLGVVFGTYSSLFVATPIVIDFIKKKN